MARAARHLVDDDALFALDPNLHPHCIPLPSPGDDPSLLHARGIGGGPVRARPISAHAPVSGIEPMPLDAIRTLSRESLSTWIVHLRSAGVQGHRVTSPDLQRQLETAARRPIDTAICNLLDPDPTTDLQARWARRHPDALLAGVLLLGRIVGATKLMIVADRAGPAGAIARDLPPRRGAIEPQITWLDHVYPLSHPSILLNELLKRRLRPGMLPPMAGAIVFDAVIAVAVGRLVLAGEPMTRVPVWCVDDQRVRGRIAPIGTRLADLLVSLGHAQRLTGALRCGPLLRAEPADPVELIGPGELIVRMQPGIDTPAPEACIRCGWCRDVCPVRALPAGILESAQRSTAPPEDWGLDACIECGLCDYVCPSRLPLLATIRSLRRSTGVSA
ncbi:MAG TPA: 4Fe-4S binding protein [Tepidisphaeraceae bacterium]|nr:4Fe-4S binding protein [Tepidisphaeraceae bacterium]